MKRGFLGATVVVFPFFLDLYVVDEFDEITFDDMYCCVEAMHKRSKMTQRFSTCIDIFV